MKLTVLKCKICGGSIQISGQAHGICEYCGSEVTLPKIDDDKRADMFNRGNFLRQKGLFDQAYSAYEHIIADNQTDAEAHWCLLLCRYGIEYVHDKRSGEYKPTCGRMSITSVLEDIDYLAALEYSEDYAKELYIKEAEKIHEIQKRYLEIARNEKPYDVFICFKAEGENNERTQGSVVGQEIYERLSKAGIRTFFSRITLENIIGEEYEPYIFSALNFARVMIVIADSPEHIQARWVRNEWSRYMAMADSDKQKKLLPVCVNMSPYDLPDEFVGVQAIDWSRIDAMETLIPVVCKHLGIGEIRKTVSAGKESEKSFEDILKRIRHYIEDEKQDNAIELLKTFLNKNPNHARANMQMVFLQYSAASFNQLLTRDSEECITESFYFKIAEKHSEGAFKEEIADFKEKYGYQWNYKLGRGAFKNQNYSYAKECFIKCSNYKDSKEYIKRCSEQIAILEEEKRKKELEIKLESEINEKKARKQQYDNELLYIDDRVKREHPVEYGKYLELKKKTESFKYHGPLMWKTVFINMLLMVIAVLGIYAVKVISGDLEIIPFSSAVPAVENFVNSYLSFMVPLFELKILGIELFFFIFIVLWCACVCLRLTLLLPENVDEYSIRLTSSDFGDVFMLAIIGAVIGTLACSLIKLIGMLLIGAVCIVTAIYAVYEAFTLLFTVPFGFRWRKCAREFVEYKENIINPIYDSTNKRIKEEYKDLNI